MRCAILSIYSGRNTINRRMLTTMALLFSGLLFGALSQSGFVQTNIGKWKLNLAKSTYSPGPAPKSGSLNFEGEG